MTPEIITKLNKFLDTHEPFKEECEVVYLMVELRKLLDREHRNRNSRQFKKIRFYSDWTVHTAKDKHQEDIKDVMDNLDKSLNNGTSYPDTDVFQFFLLSELRKEIAELFKIHGLRPNLCLDDRYWTHFVDLFIQALADQPITNPTQGISSVSFVAGSIGTKLVEVKFTDKSNSLTFGIAS